MPLTIDGRHGHAVAINGTVPGPLIRLKEGQNVRICGDQHAATRTPRSTGTGLLVPFQMDGVPGVSFPGIKPGETFVYEFPVKQSGTYWYHSHSGLQEQVGHYGPIVIDPAGADPVAYDREHVVVLSDYSFMHPHRSSRSSSSRAGSSTARSRPSAVCWPARTRRSQERIEWARMRMDPTDIVGCHRGGLHLPDQRPRSGRQLDGPVQARRAGAAAVHQRRGQTIFNVRIPGLKLTVVAADGQNVRPVEVDEFQIGNAETYDVIVQPSEDRAYTLVAEAIDRSGMGRATLAPRPGMTAEVPPLRERPLLTMSDMGMDMAP